MYEYDKDEICIIIIISSNSILISTKGPNTIINIKPTTLEED